MAKKKADTPQVNKPKFSENYIYTVDKVFDSGTTANFTNQDFTSTSWTITDAPKDTEGELKKAFTILDDKLRGLSKKNKVKFCQSCGNMYEEGLDDNFCSVECKYKYCEIEDEADKHSE